MNGVGNVDIFGGEYSIRINLKPDKLAELGLTVADADFALMDGKSISSFAVHLTNDANTLETISAVKNILAETTRNLPTLPNALSLPQIFRRRRGAAVIRAQCRRCAFVAEYAGDADTDNGRVANFTVQRRALRELRCKRRRDDFRDGARSVRRARIVRVDCEAKKCLT